MSTIQAIHVASAGPTSDVLAVTKVQAPTIEEPFDIIVRVKAVSLNPADPKVRKYVGKILGYDASGIVETAGPQALFKPGDAVLYAGAMTRPGSNAELQLVDSRIVARKPESLAWDDAAAIPLVGLTAWEMLAEKFHLVPGATKENSDHVLLVVGAAGGVGTMAMQLASKVFGIKRIIATASRPETIEWVKKFGATDVINHHEPLAPQLAALSLQPSLVFLNHSTAKYFKDLVPAMRPFGHIGSIVESDEEIPVHEGPVMQKALSFSWELMFSKTLFNYRLESQGEIIAKLAQLAESGVLPVGEFVTSRSELSLKTLREGHDLVEAGKAIGKIVFTVPEGTWN